MTTSKHWTSGSQYICIRTDDDQRPSASPSYELVAQRPVPSDDAQYSAAGDFDARSGEIVRVMNAVGDLRSSLIEAKEALSFAMRGTSDAEQSDKYAATIARIDAALAVVA